MKSPQHINVQLLTKQFEENSTTHAISVHKKAPSIVIMKEDKNQKSSSEKMTQKFLVNFLSKKLDEVQLFLKLCKTDAERLIENNDKQNIFILASIFNRFDILNFLATDFPKLFKDNMNHTDYRGFTALTWSCYKGHEQIVALLIKAGANALLPDHFGYTPLRLAFVGRHQKIIELLTPIYKTTNMLESYTQYIADCKLIKWIGHGLGLSAEIPMVTPENKVVSVQTDESTTKLNELYLFSHLLKHHTNFLKLHSPAADAHTLKYFDLILKANKQGIDYHRVKNKVSAETFAMQFLQKITFVPAGSNNHEVGLILYKNWAVLCNRGDLRDILNAGTTVFTIHNKAKITPAFIESLYPKPFAGTTIESLYEKLFDKKNGILRGENIIVKFDTKPQKFSTCSFSNVKSILPGILYLLRYEELALSTDLRAHSKLSEEAKAYAKASYKGFSVWARDYLIDYFSEKAKKAFNAGSANKELYFSLGQALLAEHHGQHRPTLQYDRSIKRKQELERAKKLSMSLYQISPIKAKKLADNLKAQGIKPSALTNILNPT